MLGDLPSMAQLPFSGTVAGWEGQTVQLLAYTGLKLDSVAVTMADGQGSFSFEKGLCRGMYLLRSKGDTEIELLYNGQPVQFVMSDANDLKTIQFVRSKINEKWSAYLWRRANYRHAVELLKSVLRQYDPQTEFYRNTAAEFVRLQSDFRLFTDSLTVNDSSYAARLIRTDRDLPTDLKQSANEQRKYLIDNFFGDVDFDDLSLIPTNVLTTKMIDYLSLYQGLPQFASNSDAGFVVGLGAVFEKAKVNMRMYEFVLAYMLEGFSALGVEPVVNYLLNYPKLGEGEVPLEQGLRLETIAAPYQKVRVGVKAPNLTGMTIDGRSYDLYVSKAKHIIVFFASSDCEYCHEFLTRIRKKLDLQSDFELVTVFIADNKAEVEDALKKMKLTGYHFYDDLRWDSKAFLDYHVSSTPSVFVLDSQKTIVLKPYNFEELIEWKRALDS